MRTEISAEPIDSGRVRPRRRKLSSDEVYEVALAALERSEAILENIGDGVFSTDAAGTIRLWNRAAQRVIGCTPREARGKCCTAVLGLRKGGEPLDCSNGCALMDATKGAPPGSSVEVVRRGSDGREQPLLINVTAVGGGDGNPTEFVHSLRDITTLKQADEAKTMFLATASHELKTPLTVILGFTQALQAEWLDEPQRDEALRSIERRAHELSRIVDRLLLTGRIDSGRVSLSPSVVSLPGLIEERAASIALVSGRKIVCEVDGDLPHVLADADALATVLDHLLDNAVKYSPGGGVVSVRVSDAVTWVEIQISDPGIGMNEDGAAHCFDRFWQAESSDVRRFGGTGVGLYIVRSLVEGMGGTIRVSTTPGLGTTFVTRLPRADGDAAGAERPVQVQVNRSIVQEFMHQLGIPRASTT